METRPRKSSSRGQVHADCWAPGAASKR
jgi:hypothetical protein